MNDTQAWLSSLKRTRRTIDNLLGQIQMLEDQATKITATMNDIGGGSTHSVDGFERTLARLIDKKDELNRLINEQLDLQQQIEQSINKIPNDLQREVIYERYILDKPFDEIADNIEKSIRYTFTLHGYGLLNVKMPEK